MNDLKTPKKSSNPKQTKISVGSDGTVSFAFADGCDQNCQNKIRQDFMKKHPQYGK